MLTHRDHCGLCHSKDIVRILDLGSMPPSNAFLTKADLGKPEPVYPLEVMFCRDCTAVQLGAVLDPRDIFTDYRYFTSASGPLVQHFHRMAESLAQRFIESSNDLVVEIGGNDGSLLEAFPKGQRVLNIDPSVNAVKMSLAKGIPTHKGFFDSHIARILASKSAKLVIANNVMAHIPDIRDAVLGVETMLAPDGVFVFEVHSFANLFSQSGWDQIYHEHVYYHTLKALKRLLEEFGLEVFDLETYPIHGEVMRVYAARPGVYPVTDGPSRQLRMEMSWYLHREDTYRDFAGRVEDTKKQLVHFSDEAKRCGASVVGYGAPAKGNTLLNYTGIHLDYIVDTTPEKQGCFTPGSHIEIFPPEKLLTDTPDHLMILAWNYAGEIKEKERVLHDRIGSFVVPMPTLWYL